jgi:hypothetical protein
MVKGEWKEEWEEKKCRIWAQVWLDKKRKIIRQGKKEERGQTEMKDRCKEKVENNKDTEKL